MKVTRVVGHLIERQVEPFTWQVDRPGSGDGRRPAPACHSALRIQTDQDIEGYAVRARGRVDMDLIERRFGPELLGNDPLNTESLWFGRVLEELRFDWYEEPMREFHLESYAPLCQDLDIPVLAAECTDGAHWNAGEFVRRRACDIMRTSTRYKGGVHRGSQGGSPRGVVRHEGVERQALQNHSGKYVRAPRGGPGEAGCRRPPADPFAMVSI